jgi:ABC-type thiamin/hydroxymethylpyrimidine transport system permease subunit
MEIIFTLILVVLCSAFISQIHMMYTCDYFAKIFGYVISIKILPLIFGGLLGSIGAALLKKNLAQGLKTYWWIPIIGAIAGILPIVNILYRISQPYH